MEYTLPTCPIFRDQLTQPYALVVDGNVSLVGTDLPPTVNMTAPADGATVSGNPVPLSATAGDDSAVVSVEFIVDGGTPIPGSDAGGGVWTASWDSNSVADGDHTITARATDDAAQPTTSASTTVTVDNDDEFPTVSMTAPSNSVYVTGDLVALAADASDDGAVDSVVFIVEGSPPIPGTDAGGGVWTASWDSRGPSDGTPVSIRADATDNSGQLTPSAAINVTVDNTAPTVTVEALPAPPATVSGNQEVSATAGDGLGSGVAQVEFFANGQSIGVDGSSGGGWSIDWDTTGVDNGAYNVTAIATDGVGLTTEDPTGFDVTVYNSVAAGVSASLIAYGRHGGRNANKHLDVTVSVVDSLGNLVEGASVSITITVDGGGPSASGSGVTSATGDVVFTWHNAPGPGTCFTTTVDALSASGLSWDEDMSPTTSVRLKIE